MQFEHEIDDDNYLVEYSAIDYRNDEENRDFDIFIDSIELNGIDVTNNISPYCYHMLMEQATFRYYKF